LNENEVRNIPLGCPVFDEEMEAAAVNALRNERFVLGEDVSRFEEEFARYVGTRYAVSTSSGTNALQIAFLALGLAKGDEVVTSAFSFIASANAILHADGVSIFADIDSSDFNVDPEKMRLKVSKKTRALLPVHLYGYPCRMREIREIAEEHGLWVVEDACQAHGAEYAGRKVGGLGDVGCFSFYPSKNMTVCGDGGMIVTNDEVTAKLAAKLRDCGRKTQYEHDKIGFTSRLNTVNAAIARVQLKRLDCWNTKRIRIASMFDKLLSDLDEIMTPPKPNSGVKPVYHCYVIRTRNRNELKSWLQQRGIQCGIHYPLPIPSQPIYRQLFGYKPGDYPFSERASAVCLSLPMYPYLTDDNVDYISECIHEFFRSR
jgi:perosamine synthetase